MISTLSKVTIGGKAYPISWGQYAIDLYTSIPFEDRQLQGAASIAQFLWSQIAIIDNPPFKTWRAALFALSNETPDNREVIAALVNEQIPVVESKPDSAAANTEPPDAAEKKSDS
jgi:hypothetical protein